MNNSEEIIKLLRKYGTVVRRYASKKEPGLYVITCPGCKKLIRTDDPAEVLGSVDYAINKRGGITMFHGKCFRKAWDSKIPSKDEV